jgi:hypothetical protein
MGTLLQLQKYADWQQQYTGRQAMQLAVLKWAMDHKEAVQRAGLADSLVAAMESELTLHNAAKPSC